MPIAHNPSKMLTKKLLFLPGCPVYPPEKKNQARSIAWWRSLADPPMTSSHGSDRPCNRKGDRDMSTQMPQKNYYIYCCDCPVNSPENRKPESQKKDDSNRWLWAALIGGGLAIVLSGCVPQASTSNPSDPETLNPDPQTSPTHVVIR